MFVVTWSSPYPRARVVFREFPSLESLAQVSQLVREDGCNAVMFAYGPTGTGKTHTMGTLGVEAEEGQGVLPRAVRQVRAT